MGRGWHNGSNIHSYSWILFSGVVDAIPRDDGRIEAQVDVILNWLATKILCMHDKHCDVTKRGEIDCLKWYGSKPTMRALPYERVGTQKSTFP